MNGYLLPLSQDPWQVMTLDVVIDGEPFHAQVEIRYLPAPDQWVLSIWNHATSELLVNMIPLNNVEESPLKPSSRENIRRFQQILERSGITATVRRSLGGDIDASCGQLRRKQLLGEH